MAYRKPVELSGGEQQRVAIARALINDPALVLADEPTGNVDSKTGRDIFELLRRLCREQGATVVVVTHNLELASMTDRIIHLRDGMIVREVEVS
jgi:putative ABC transport system ATP-binding protein